MNINDYLKLGRSQNYSKKFWWVNKLEESVELESKKAEKFYASLNNM